MVSVCNVYFVHACLEAEKQKLALEQKKAEG